MATSQEQIPTSFIGDGRPHKIAKVFHVQQAHGVKCRDCIGASYFCNDCCLLAHKQSPFHQISHRTGAHFAPISLHSLGFQLCIGHDGDPCTLTVEVLWFEFLQLIYWLTWSKGIKAADNHLCPKQTSRQTRSSSLQPVKEEHIPSAGLPSDPQAPLHQMVLRMLMNSARCSKMLTPC